MKLRIGSRGSQLALWQANHIAELLRVQGHEVEIQVIKTTGDRLQDVAFADVGSKGMFTKEIEEALADCRVDLAVHSLKDLPTDLPAGFALAATPVRADPRDVFVSINHASLAELPRHARVGTSSQRRRAQLKALRKDVEAVEFRGNVDTRLRKLSEGQVDAILLAAAGLDRLGKTDWVRERLDPQDFCPAPGQGALAVEIRSGDVETLATVNFLDHADTRFAVTAERAALAALGGGCQVPIGIHCRPSFARNASSGAWVEIFGVVASPETGKMIRVHLHAPREKSDPVSLGHEAAEVLLEEGAGPMLAAGIRSRRSSLMTALPLVGKRILVTRAAHQAGKLSEGLRALGVEPVEVAVIEIRPPADFAPLDRALRELSSYDWLILTSANTVHALADRAVSLGLSLAAAPHLKVAAVGEVTAAAARNAGLPVALVPESYVAECLAESLAEQTRGEKVLLARASVARDVIPDVLRAAGAIVDVVDAYRNVMPEAAPALLREALQKGIAAVAFTSSSTVTHLADAAHQAGIAFPFAGVAAISIGPITSRTLRELGWEPAAEAAQFDVSGLIQAVARALV